MKQNKSKEIQNSSQEVSPIILLRILYEGKLIIFLCMIMFLILGTTFFYYKNLNQNFFTEILVLEKEYFNSEFDELKSYKLEMEKLVNEINLISKGEDIEIRYIDVLTLTPFRFMKNINNEAKQTSFIPRELKENTLEYSSSESSGMLKFSYSYENEEDFDEITTLILDKINSRKEFYASVDKTFTYLDNFIKNKIKTEEVELNRYKFMIKVNKEIFLENLKEYNDADSADVLFRLNNIFSDIFIKLNYNSNIPDSIKLKMFNNKFVDYDDIRTKFDTLLSLELPMLNVYKTLIEKQNNLEKFENEIINIINSTNFVDIVEKDIVKKNQNNLILVGLLSLILGLSIGVFLILFRYSLKS